jgi:DNA polymerase-3 subunit alpha
MVEKNWDVKLDIRNFPLDDEKTYKLYQSGKTAGCFQVESYGMQKTLKEIAPDKFEDVIAAIALFRPGPMDNIPSFVNRKFGREDINYYHGNIEPHVKRYLEPTYGILVYQEQIMQVCNALGGLTLIEAYEVIKGVGKKKLDIIAKYEKKFIKGCLDKGVPEHIAKEYWGSYDPVSKKLSGFILPFANYGFNKSHALAYAYNSYMTVFLKANYPEEFMCASLNVESERKKWNKTIILEKDLARSNISLLPRNINHCGMSYEIVKHASGRNRGEIMPSLLCQGMKKAAAVEIVNSRPKGGFKDIVDFATRTSTDVDSASVQALAIAGYFPKAKPKEIVKTFETIRSDLKKCNQKGVPSDDMFE